MKTSKILFLIIFAIANELYSQVYPREQTIQAGEYFVNVDPGEGNGIPISAQYGSSSVNFTTNIQLEKGDVAYVRFKNSNEKWSSPRGIKYRFYDLVNAQYYIKYSNGSETQYQNMQISNEPTNSPFFLAVSNNIPSLTKNDTVFVQFKSENHFWSKWSKIEGVVDVIGHNGLLPKAFKLYSAYPNPFNPITTIKYSVPVSCSIKIIMFDLLGKNISTLVNEEKMPGNYEIKFDGENISSGVYFYRIQAGSFTDTKKLVLLR